MLQCIKYNEHQWQLCCDLRIVALVVGLRGGYTKYYCFLWEEKNRASVSRYIRRERPPPKLFESEMKNEKCPSLTEPNKIFLLPPLEIKLGLMKNVKACINMVRIQVLNIKITLIERC